MTSPYTRKPYRIFADKPLKRRIIVSGPVVVELGGIELSAGVGVGVVCLYGLGVACDDSVVVVVGEALDDLSATVGQGYY